MIQTYFLDTGKTKLRYHFIKLITLFS